MHLQRRHLFGQRRAGRRPSHTDSIRTVMLDPGHLVQHTMSNSSQQMMINEESEHSAMHPSSYIASVCQYGAETPSASSHTGIFTQLDSLYLCEHVCG